MGTPTLLVARPLSLLPRALSNLSTGPLDFMVSGWMAGLLAAGPEQCWGLAWGFLEAAWPRRPLPLGGGEAVWLLCGEAWPWKWREVQAGKGQVAAPGSGVGEDVGEARRSDSQELPCWECQPKIFGSPQLLWSCLAPGGPPCAGVCGPEVQPWNQPV